MLILTETGCGKSFMEILVVFRVALSLFVMIGSIRQVLKGFLWVHYWEIACYNGVFCFVCWATASITISAQEKKY